MVPATSRPARVRIDLEAVRDNAARLVSHVAPAQLCAVVKADAYGHGALPVARAAIAGGASWLAVAVVDEGLALRVAGIDHPILLLSEPPPDAMADAHGGWLTPTLYTAAGVEAAERAALAGTRPWPVHVKVNTGMNRVGVDPDELPAIIEAVRRSPHLELEGLWTHLAVADEPDRPETDEQLEAFSALAAAVGDEVSLLYAANSAAALTRPASHLDLVRCGISLYGVPPGTDVEVDIGLRPAMSVTAEVSFVKRVLAGESISYGHRFTFDRPATVATIPIGYADGVSRRLSNVGGEVLIRGNRHRIVGSITMDQLMVDCGDDVVEVGDETVLIGEQGNKSISATDWATALDTIAYEVVCGFGPRLPRVVDEPTIKDRSALSA